MMHGIVERGATTRSIVMIAATIAALFAAFYMSTPPASAAIAAPTMTGGPSNGSTVATSSVTFSFTASGAALTQCQIGADPTVYACGSPQAFTLPDGIYSFNVAAGDGAGDWATTTVSFTIDTVTPLTVTASAGAGGTITPSGAVAVTPGNDQSFTIAADSGFNIADVVVDGLSVGATTTHTFSDVIEAHTISASFSLIPAPAPAPSTPSPALNGGSPGNFGLVNSGSETFSSLSASVSVAPPTPPAPFVELPLIGLTPGVPSTGEVPHSTSFFFTTTLSRGDRSEEVLELQRRLMSMGLFDHDVPTGYFGPITERGVKAFQLKSNLPQVGVVGPMTRTILNAMYASAMR